MIDICLATEQDWPKLWPLIQTVFQSGESYPYAPETSEEEAFYVFMKSPTETYVALEKDQLLGAYYLKPNQPGLGSHVCNAGYMVAKAARGKGVGQKLGAHSLDAAKKLGFTAMQFNFVVSTNTSAVRLWQKMGFEIVGTVPKGFQHHAHGLVDAYLMYREL